MLKPFLRPERPFLLIYKDEEEQISYSWLENEEEILEVIDEVVADGCEVIEAIEIDSCRDI